MNTYQLGLGSEPRLINQSTPPTPPLSRFSTNQAAASPSIPKLMDISINPQTINMSPKKDNVMPNISPFRIVSRKRIILKRQFPHFKHEILISDLDPVGSAFYWVHGSGSRGIKLREEQSLTNNFFL